MKNTIIINGTVIQTNAKSICVKNNKVYTDGDIVEIDDNQKEISIEVQGDIESIKADVVERIDIKGCIKESVSTQTGAVHCGNVCGSVCSQSGSIEVMGSISSYVNSNSGDIRCRGDIGGDAKTMSGDISAGGNIAGRCSTMSGDIRHR